MSLRNYGRWSSSAFAWWNLADLDCISITRCSSTVVNVKINATSSLALPQHTPQKPADLIEDGGSVKIHTALVSTVYLRSSRFEAGRLPLILRDVIRATRRCRYCRERWRAGIYTMSCRAASVCNSDPLPAKPPCPLWSVNSSGISCVTSR